MDIDYENDTWNVVDNFFSHKNYLTKHLIFLMIL